MVSSSHRVSRPTPRRLSGRHHTPYKSSHAPIYSHINIQPAPDIREGEGNEGSARAAGSTGFIRNSLQDKIADELAYANKLAPRSSSESPPGSRPTTFAEAAMSTRVRSGGGRTTGNNDDKFDASPTRSKPTEVLGKLKYTKKKKKVQKWAPLDLSATETTSVVGNIWDTGTSQNVSPSSTSLVTYQTQPDKNLATFESETPIAKSKCVVVQDSYYNLDTDSTPTQARFNSSSLVSYSENRPILHDYYSSTLDPIDPNFIDTEETKNKFATVMAHLHQYVSPMPPSAGGDAFDSLNWDPDLPSASSPDKSPEPIVAKPQAIAYTTVGSLVNPNIVPQFTAPNRIQREGAGRRPLITMANRQYDNSFQARGPPPPLSMQNSMHYTQQLLQAPPNFEITSPKTSLPSHLRLAKMIRLTEQEKQVLGQAGESLSRATLASISGKGVNQASSSQSSSSASGATNQSFRLRDLIDEDDLNRSHGNQGPKQGLEKMQTLQRLARFENPMRAHALNRLSEFSVANASAQVIPKTTASAPNRANPSLESMLRNSQRRSTVDAQTKSQGELDRGYQFPQTVLAASSTTQANPLFGAYSASTHNSSAPSRPPGYPQPLTAGPPGQRQSIAFANTSFSSARFVNAASSNLGLTNRGLSQNRPTAGFSAPINSDFNPDLFAPSFLNHGYLNNSSSGRETPSFGESVQGSESGTRSYYQPETSTNSIWESRLQTRPYARTGTLDGQAVAPTSLGPHTLLRDTLSPDSMSKYYPHGFPPGIAETYLPVASENSKMDQILKDEETPEQKETRKEKERDDQFYFGQRQYFMSAEQHIEELERRQPPSTNPFGPIAPPRKTYPHIATKEITPEDVNKLSTADAAQQPLEAAFGSLLRYSESSTYSNSKLSGWIIPPSRYVDNTVEGNKTLFGEDWGHAKPASRVSSHGGRR